MSLFPTSHSASIHSGAAEVEISAPLTDELIASLRAGDQLYISGVLYVARDAAHKRLVESLDQGRSLPFDLQGQIIYYMGPSPARPGHPIGSAGPTTSYRMDPYTVRLLELGLKGMIGKGSRSLAIREALKKHKAIYMVTIGGAAALIAQTVVSSEVVAYEDLGAEALRRLLVRRLPAIVANDIYGGDIFEQGQARYRRR